MEKYSKEELEEALHILSSIIVKCERMQTKFREGTSQHTLLKNRIKALHISESLIISENAFDKYTKDELSEALRPISSIISKCEKARGKYAEGTSNYTRFEGIIKSMYISKSLITLSIDNFIKC